MKNFIIKSISDLITNSSSEVFCVISGTDSEILDNIHTDLYEFFDCWKQESEQTLCLSDFDKQNDAQIKIEVPYHKDKFLDLYKAVIEELCKDKPVIKKYHYDRFV